MSRPERDPVTGRLTTGHEWNGIKELNSPVPRIVFATLILGAIYMVIATILLPAWPGVSGYTRGILGVDQRDIVSSAVERARLDRTAWTDLVDNQSLEESSANPALMEIVREAGNTLFVDNCAACHGREGSGGPGFPNIAAATLSFGDDLDALEQTIRVGINSGLAGTRTAQMPAFGGGMLARADISLLVGYVLGLSSGDDTQPDTAAADLFTSRCAGCHGAEATGNTMIGAPNLTDPYWIHGGERQAVFTSISGGRAGHMPHWEGRLSPTDIRVLALYVHDLRENNR